MSSCTYSIKLSAYHDGELPPEDRDEVWSHLENCADCREEMEELAALSGVLASGPVRHISSPALQRLHEHGVPADDQRWVLRGVKAMTAAAVIVLVISCWHLAHRWSLQGSGSPTGTQQPAVERGPGPAAAHPHVIIDGPSTSERP